VQPLKTVATSSARAKPDLRVRRVASRAGAAGLGKFMRAPVTIHCALTKLSKQKNLADVIRRKAR